MTKWTKLALTDRNKHAEKFLTVVLKFWDYEFFGTTEPPSKNFYHAYFYLSELIYFVHLAMADPVYWGENSKGPGQ